MSLELKIYKTPEEVEKLRGFWTSCKSDPEADINFVQFINQSRREILHPYVMVAEKDGKPVALLAGRVEDGTWQVRLGYKALFCLKIRRISIFYGGLMGQTDAAVSEAIISRLMLSLREEGADSLMWSGVQRDSELEQALNRVPGFLCRDHLALSIPRWKMTMPASLEELLEKRMNKKHRYWAKRTMRLLEKDFPGAVKFACYTAPAEMDRLFADVIKVAAKTYQWALGVGFRDSEEQQKRTMLESENGWLRGYVVYVRDEPVAFWICTVYHDTVYSDYTGYDPVYRKYEIGTALFLHMVGEMCKEQKSQLDFGPGTALYKERFGDSRFLESTYCVSSSSARGIFLNMLRLMTEGPLELVRTLVRRLGLEQKLKKAWRNRATADQTAKAALQPEA